MTFFASTITHQFDSIFSTCFFFGSRADTDKDSYLSPVELAAWINNKTQEHIHKAMMENYGLFTAIDLDPRNGK